MKKNKSTIVIAEKSGRLGNRLFVFAHLIAYAQEHGLTVINPAFDDYRDYFRSTGQNKMSVFPEGQAAAIPAFFKRKHAFYLTEKFAGFLHAFHIHTSTFRCTRISLNDRIDLDRNPLASAKYHFIQGWLFRAPQLFILHQDLIRDFFVPANQHRERIDLFIANLRSTCDLLVGVHIRQQDYRIWEGGKYYYTLDQYSSLIQNVENLWNGKRVLFLICSNTDLSDSGFYSTKMVPGPNHELEDLYSLAGCDCILGPPSTYTLWASFYGKVPLYMIEDIDKKPALTDFKVNQG